MASSNCRLGLGGRQQHLAHVLPVQSRDGHDLIGASPRFCAALAVTAVAVPGADEIDLVQNDDVGLSQRHQIIVELPVRPGDALGRIEDDDQQIGRSRRSEGRPALCLARGAVGIGAGSVHHREEARVASLVDPGGARHRADRGLAPAAPLTNWLYSELLPVFTGPTMEMSSLRPARGRYWSSTRSSRARTPLTSLPAAPSASRPVGAAFPRRRPAYTGSTSLRTPRRELLQQLVQFRHAVIKGGDSGCPHTGRATPRRASGFYSKTARTRNCAGLLPRGVGQHLIRRERWLRHVRPHDVAQRQHAGRGRDGLGVQTQSACAHSPEWPRAARGRAPSPRSERPSRASSAT